MESSDGRKKRASKGPLGWTARRKSLVLEIVRQRKIGKIGVDAIRGAAIAKTLPFRSNSIHSRPRHQDDEGVAKEDRIESRRRAATSAAAKVMPRSAIFRTKEGSFCPLHAKVMVRTLA